MLICLISYFLISLSYQVSKRKSDELQVYDRNLDKNDILHDEMNEDMYEACNKKLHRDTHPSKNTKRGNETDYLINSSDEYSYEKDQMDSYQKTYNEGNRSQGGRYDADYVRDERDRNGHIRSDGGRNQYKATEDERDRHGHYLQYDRDRRGYDGQNSDYNQYRMVHGERQDRNYDNHRHLDRDRYSSDEGIKEKERAEELMELRHKILIKNLTNEADMEEEEFKRRRNLEELRISRLHIEYLVGVKSHH